MKSILTTGLLAMACLTAYSHASAQTTMTAKIPFEFAVGQKVLPPGTYLITQVASRIIEFENLDKRVSVYASTVGADYVSQKPRELVFHKYGNQYFLHEVRGGLGQFSMDLSPSKVEKETERLAKTNANQQGTEVALQSH
jgi:hypothetical protein